MNWKEARWLGRAQGCTVAISAVLEAVGLAALACIVVVTVVDVVGDKVFGWPVAGSTEIIGLLQVVAISGGLAFSKVDGKQIYVGFLFDSVRGGSKTALEILTSLLALAFWVIACWMLFDYGFALEDRGTGTFILGVPHYPFVFWVAICGGIMMSLLIILDVVDAVARGGKGGDAR